MPTEDRPQFLFEFGWCFLGLNLKSLVAHLDPSGRIGLEISPPKWRFGVASIGGDDYKIGFVRQIEKRRGPFESGFTTDSGEKQVGHPRNEATHPTLACTVEEDVKSGGQLDQGFVSQHEEGDLFKHEGLVLRGTGDLRLVFCEGRIIVSSTKLRGLWIV